MTTENVNDIQPAAVAAAKRKRKRFRWLVVLGLLLVCLGPYLYYRATSFANRIRLTEIDQSHERRDVRADSFKVMCWNIAHGRGTAKSNWSESGAPKAERIMRIAEFIEKVDPDIVVLNEVDFSATWSGGFDQATAIAQRAGYKYVVRQTNLDFGFVYGRWQFGNAVLSKLPILEHAAIDLPAHKTWEDWVVGRKRGMHVQVQLFPDQDPVHLLGLHLESRSEETRVESVRFLNSYLAKLEGPVLLAGDLNTTPPEAPRSGKTKSGENAFQILVQESDLKHFRVTKESPTERLTFPAWEPVSAIDWILFRGLLQYRNHQVLQTKLSDHLPIVVDVYRNEISLVD